MPRIRSVPIRFDDNYLRIIKELMDKLGIGTRAGVIRHAIARLAHDENVSMNGPREKTKRGKQI